eukprot:8214681-Pyramimonas_sp.AAC.1
MGNAGSGSGGIERGEMGGERVDPRRVKVSAGPGTSLGPTCASLHCTTPPPAGVSQERELRLAESRPWAERCRLEKGPALSGRSRQLQGGSGLRRRC